jgi:hypothetical protein
VRFNRERGRGNSFAGRNFGEEEKIQGKKDFGQIHIMKSHFEDEERLRGEKTWDKYIFGKSHFVYEERLRRQKEIL